MIVSLCGICFVGDDSSAVNEDATFTPNAYKSPGSAVNDVTNITGSGNIRLEPGSYYIGTDGFTVTEHSSEGNSILYVEKGVTVGLAFANNGNKTITVITVDHEDTQLNSLGVSLELISNQVDAANHDNIASPRIIVDSSGNVSFYGYAILKTGTVSTGRSVTISAGFLRIQGALINDGTIINNAAGEVQQSDLGLLLTGNSSMIKSSDNTLRGTISGSCVPLATVSGGSLSYQTINCAYHNEQAIAVRLCSDNTVNILNNKLNLPASGRGIQIEANSNSTIVVSGNTIDSNGADVSSLFRVIVYDGSMVDLTGNSFNIGTTVGTHGIMQIESENTTSGANLIKTSALTPNSVKIDDSIVSIRVANCAEGKVVSINDNLSFSKINLVSNGRLAVSSGKTLTIPEAATLTIASGCVAGVEGTVLNNGSVVNNGSIVIGEGRITGEGEYSGTGDISVFTVAINIGAHMTKTSGDNEQTVIKSLEMETVTYTVDEGFEFPAGYSKTLNGITVTRISSTQITVTGTPTADTVINLDDASVIQYTVTVKTNGGSFESTPVGWTGTDGVYTKKFDINTDIAIIAGSLPAPTLTGYLFSAWAPNTGTLTADLVIEAGYLPIHYTIAFDKNSDGASGTTAAVAATYDENATLTAVGFTRADYAFGGWATSSTGAAVYSDKAVVKNLSSTDGATVTLYAVWIQVEKTDNAAVITVTTDAVSDQAAEQLVEAAKQMKDAGTENVTVDVKATETEAVSIKSDSVKDAVDSGIGVNISTSKGAMEFSSEALAGLIEDGKTLKSEIKEIEVPPAYAEKIPADAKVFSISLTSNDVAITSFGSAFTVKVAYEASGNTDNLYVGYLAANGTIQKMESHYENGFMVFTTDHLSDYAVLEESSSSGADNQGLFLAIFLVAAIVLPIIAALIIFRKK